MKSSLNHHCIPWNHHEITMKSTFFFPRSPWVKAGESASVLLLAHLLQDSADHLEGLMGATIKMLSQQCQRFERREGLSPMTTTDLFFYLMYSSLAIWCYMTIPKVYCPCGDSFISLEISPFYITAKMIGWTPKILMKSPWSPPSQGIPVKPRAAWSVMYETCVPPREVLMEFTKLTSMRREDWAMETPKLNKEHQRTMASSWFSHPESSCPGKSYWMHWPEI